VIRLVIADDQRVVRAGLAVILGSAPDIELVGQAADGREALALCRAERPDVLVTDIRMPVMNGVEATRAVVADPDLATAVLVITTFDVDEYVFGALEAGAAGFLLKGADEDSLLAAVRSVAAGDGTLDQRLTRRVLLEFAERRAPRRVPAVAPALTPRELDVLRLLARGLSNAEIADRLVVEQTTVKYHVSAVLQKLDARDRLQAVVAAYRLGLADLDD
jgi:DNA-binding NarL/FixJ family response regulator